MNALFFSPNLRLVDKCAEIVKKREAERKEDTSSASSKDSCSMDDDPESLTAPGKSSPAPNGGELEEELSEENSGKNKTRKLEDSATAGD